MAPKCKLCGKGHHWHDHMFLKSKGSTVNLKGYLSAHEKASKAEKKKYGAKAYKSLEKLDREAGRKHELVGKNTPSGKISVAKAVPKSKRAEVAYHEKVESKELRKK